MICNIMDALECKLILLISLFASVQTTWVDLSHSYNESSLFWPISSKFMSEIEKREFLESGDWYSSNRICTGEHSGTHLDAPYHFFYDGWTTEQIPLDHLIHIRAAVIDISSRISANEESTQLTIQDLLNWEALHGRIPHDGIVIMRTGWTQYWFEPAKYFNYTDSNNTSTYNFPAIETDAATWLVNNRKIVGVGLDTPSVDSPGNKIQTHVVLQTKNIYILENLINVDQLPAEGAFIYALPMKIGGKSSGAPCRVLALLKDESYGFVQLIKDSMQSISLL